MTANEASGAGRAVRAAGRVLLGLLAGAGCRPPAVTFPFEPVSSGDRRSGFDTDGDGRADFFLLVNEDGRVDRIGYDRTGDGEPDRLVHLDAIDRSRARHLVLVLDGVPFDVLSEFRAEGRLRVFHAPAAMVAPYPVMTDLALQDAFGDMPAPGLQARHYSRARRQVVGGNRAYLAGKNEPYVRLIQHRTGSLNDAFTYLYPKAVFDKEINDVKRLWDRREHQELVAYFVSSAGLGTRKGKEGQRYALRRCEQLIHQVLFETGGLVKVTFFADHGQTNVPCRPVDLSKHLAEKGWRVTGKVRGEKDVAVIRFGLVTYAAMHARRPAALASDLLTHPRVTLASYAEGDAVVVRTSDARAMIRSTDGQTFRYERVRGDPLKLGDLVGETADGRALLKATVEAGHEYPDPLYRLWRAHFALAENAPDVLVSLDDRSCHGSGFFARQVSMASTHGGLSRANSLTFFMSTAGRVEGPLRNEDVPGAVKGLFGRPFPYGR